MKRIVLTVIHLYRILLSPYLRPVCRFEPTCSAYAAQAVERFGVVGGVRRAIARLGRCHPFGGSGYDPVE